VFYIFNGSAGVAAMTSVQNRIT